MRNKLFFGFVLIIFLISFISAGSGSFYIGNKSTPSQTYFFVNGTTGMIGIGTTTPSSMLHISGTLPVINLTDTDTGAVSQISANGGVGNLALSADVNNAVASSLINFLIDGSEKMRIDVNGRLGIGTTTPSQTLDVRGQGNFSGTVFINNATDLSKINTTSNIQGILNTTYIHYGDVIMTNPFGGKQLYINSINDAMFRADDRWVVTGAYYSNVDNSYVGAIDATSLSNLFDGSYDTYLSIPANQYANISVNFSTESNGYFPGYPYGTFYISHYFTGYSSSAILRVYNNYTSQGVGWKLFDFTDFYRNGNSQLIIQAADESDFQRLAIEFDIFSNDTNVTSVSEIDLRLSRPGTTEMPFLDKFKANTLYDRLSFENGTSVVTIKIANSGSSYFNGGNVGIGTTSPITKFEVNGTGNIALFGNRTKGVLIQTLSTSGGVVGYNGTGYNNLDIRATSAEGSGIYLPATGNVGIGTTSPTNPLTISSTSATGLMINRTDGALNSNMRFTNTGGSIYLGLSPTFNFAIGTDVNLDTTPYFVINSSSGNVGIGTTSPDNSLYVNASNQNFGGITINGTDNSYNYGLTISVPNNKVWHLSSEGAGAGAGNFFIQEGATTRLMIQNTSGNVGIGTTIPTHKLNVNGDVNISGDTGNIIFDNTGVRQIFTRATTSYIDANTTGGQFSFIVNGNLDSNPSLFLQSTGNVGIGTGSPQYPLDVVGTISSTTSIPSLLLNDTTAGENGFGITANGNKLYISNNTGSVSNALFTILNSGKVGIGTGSPIYDLHIKDTGYVNSQLFAAFTSTGGGMYIASGSLGDGYAYIVNGSGTNKVLLNSGGNSYFNGGNVGIGTTSPGAKLQVNGTVNTSIAYFGGTANNINEYYDLVVGIDNNADMRYGVGIRATTTVSTPAFRNPRLGLFVQNTDTYLPADRVERLSILSSGNVGIGTTSPKYPLDIYYNNGTGDTSNLIVERIYKNDTGGSTRFALGASTNAYASIELNSMYAGTNRRYGNYGDLNIVNEVNSSSVYNNINFVTNGTVVMTVGGGSQTGNVGIGTTAPGDLLDVHGNVSLGVYGVARLIPDTNVNGNARTLRFDFGSANADEGFQFYNSNTATNLMMIKGNGNIGVGTITPTGKLTVSNNGYQGFEIFPNNTANTNLIINYDRVGNIYNDVQIRANSHQFLINTTEMMRISSTGNVGIGTTIPTHKLNVNGDVNISGDTGNIIFDNTGVRQIFTRATTSYIDANTTGGQLSFIVNGNSDSSPSLFLKSDGNVGIGTGSPVTKLQVDTSGYALSIGPAGGAVMPAFKRESAAGGLYIDKVNSTGGFSSNLMTLLGGGNVGIGTVSPTLKLQVHNLANSGGGQIGYYGDATHYAYVNPYNETNANFEFTTQNLVGGDFVFSGGNVGIGTATPSAKLEVNSTGAYWSGTPSLLIQDGTSRATLTLNSSKDTDSPTDLVFKTGGLYSWDISSRGNITDDRKLIFYPGNDAGTSLGTGVLTLQRNGYVGIGTTTPAQTLSIVSSGGAVEMNLSEPTAGSAASMYLNNPTRQWELGADSSPDIFYIGSPTTGTQSTFVINGSNGYVGIGTSSPQGKLAISNNGAEGVEITPNGASGNPLVVFYNRSSSNYLPVNFNAFNFTFNYGSTTNIMTLLSTGVGIGTSSPDTLLHAYSSSASSVIKSQGNASNLYGGFRTMADTTATLDINTFGSSRTDGLFGTTGGNYSAIYSSGVDSKGLLIGTYNDDSLIFGINNAEKMRINATTGNVGIGTTTPSQKLDIQGNILVNDTSSGIRFALGSVTSTNRIQTYNSSNSPTIRFLDWSNSYAAIGAGSLSIGSYGGTNTTFGNIITSGNVGIGTTSPNQKLQVVGDVNISEVVYASGFVSPYFRTDSRNISIGYSAGNNPEGYNGGEYINAIGYQSGQYNNGSFVNAIGYQSGQYNNGSYLNAIGGLAGAYNIGVIVDAFGYQAGSKNRGNFSVAVGYQSGYDNRNNYLSALGYKAGYFNEGAYLSALGPQSGQFNDGASVISIGNFSGDSNTGNNSIFIGNSAGYSNIGDNVTSIGYQAGYYNKGNNSIFLGNKAGTYNNISNLFIVQDKSINANPLIYGNFSSGNVGIGTSTPRTALDVKGVIDFGGTLGNGSLSYGLIPGVQVVTLEARSPNTAVWLREYGASAGNGIYIQNGTGNVGIGTTSPISTLSVGGAGLVNVGIWGTGSTYGVAGNSSYSGVYGEGSNYGVVGSDRSSNQIGVSGVTATGKGVQGVATSSGTGVFGQAGVGISPSIVANTGVNGAGTKYDFYASGNGTDYGTSSSIRWKYNITEIDSQLALNKILHINGSYFNWNIYNGQHDMGFIAEQIGEIVPEVVMYEDSSNSSNWYTDISGNKKLYASGVDYGALTPMLVQAIKGQQEIIMQQNVTINSMKVELCKKDNSYSWC